MQNSLEDILAKKKSNLDKNSPKWEKNREEWIERTQCLFKLIKKWLRPLEKNNYLRVSSSDIHISEELLGQYSLKSLIITFFNNQKVELIPIGLYVIGAKGRVDMRIGNRIIKIVGNIENSEWSFSEREGRAKPHVWAFSEESFKDILTEYAETF